MRFLLVKSVPKLFWSSSQPLTLKPPLTSVIFLVVGLVIFGLGEALLIAAGVGVSPWTVLAQGVASVMDWSIGFSTFVTSALVLVCWIPLRQIPGIGTILNAIIVALVLDNLLPYLPRPDDLILQVLMAFLGVMVTGFGGALYLIANLGPGPRDGLMTGLQKLTNMPIAWVRTGLEVLAITAGWVLGGTVGIGTILFALGIGPATAASMFGMEHFLGDRDPNTENH